MKNIVPKIYLKLTNTASQSVKFPRNLSKMWTKVLNLENSLFLELKESLRIEEFSSKESKLIKILDFAEISRSSTLIVFTPHF